MYLIFFYKNNHILNAWTKWPKLYWIPQNTTQSSIKSSVCNFIQISPMQYQGNRKYVSLVWLLYNISGKYLIPAKSWVETFINLWMTLFYTRSRRLQQVVSLEGSATPQRSSREENSRVNTSRWQIYFGVIKTSMWRRVWHPMIACLFSFNCHFIMNIVWKPEHICSNVREEMSTLALVMVEVRIWVETALRCEKQTRHSTGHLASICIPVLETQPKVADASL